MSSVNPFPKFMSLGVPGGHPATVASSAAKVPPEGSDSYVSGSASHSPAIAVGVHLPKPKEGASPRASSASPLFGGAFTPPLSMGPLSPVSPQLPDGWSYGGELGAGLTARAHLVSSPVSEPWVCRQTHTPDNHGRVLEALQLRALDASPKPPSLPDVQTLDDEQCVLMTAGKQPELEPGPAGIRQRAEFFASACDGFAYAQEGGIVHRDINPSCLLQRVDRSDALIIDWGGGKSIKDLAPDWFHGTPPFIAPEGVGDHPADVWALGACMVHAATHRPPGLGVTTGGIAGAADMGVLLAKGIVDIALAEGKLTRELADTCVYSVAVFKFVHSAIDDAVAAGELTEDAGKALKDEYRMNFPKAAREALQVANPDLYERLQRRLTARQECLEKLDGRVFYPEIDEQPCIVDAMRANPDVELAVSAMMHPDPTRRVSFEEVARRLRELLHRADDPR